MKAVVRPVPLRVEIARTVQELIVRGELACGRHLVEADLAASLGVSRLPVREALQLLSRDRWVDLKSGYGAFVHTPTAREIDEVFSVRTALEAEAAGQAAIRIARAQICKDEQVVLQQLLENGAKDVPKGINNEIVDHNANLHSMIISMSGNQVLAEMTGVIEMRVRWYFSAIAVRRAPASWEEHRALVDAILSGDPKRARDLMAGHCERSRMGLLNLPESLG